MYEPKLGFGKLWRENSRVRDRLGHATAPDETAYTVAYREFGRHPGVTGHRLIDASTPEGPCIYAVYFTCPPPDPTESSPCGASYERFPVPGP